MSLVEHPARLGCGPELAVREFAPSYRRGTVLQASLALGGSLAAIFGAWKHAEPKLLVGGLLLLAVVPFTLVVILPTNKRLLNPSLDPKSREAVTLLTRWGHLHAVRVFLSFAAFVVFVWRLANG